MQSPRSTGLPPRLLLFAAIGLALSLDTARAAPARLRGVAHGSKAAPDANAEAEEAAQGDDESGDDAVDEPPASAPQAELPPAPAAPSTGFTGTKIAALRAAIEAVLHRPPLRAARVGVIITVARTGRVLLADNAGELLCPASNTKIATTSTALALLGPDYEYRTRIVGAPPDEAGVVHGSVMLVGGHDPTLRTMDLMELASGLAAAGVARIDGAIEVHDDDGLSLLRGGALGGGRRLVEALLDAGIAVRGVTMADRAPGPRDQTLAEHDSEPLAVIVRTINKDSDNFLADSLLKTVGLERGGAYDFAAGLRVEQRYLASIGLKPGSYVLNDGSGLSHGNRISAAGISLLLRRMYDDFQIGPDWLATLAIGGLDGTLRRRFVGHPAAGWVRGKTGTLDEVSTLSGFVGTGDGPEDVLAFSILVNDFGGRRAAVRKAQVAMVDAMIDYLRGATFAER